MEVIIGLHPAYRASIRHQHVPVKPTFRFRLPIKTVDLLLSLKSRFLFFLGPIAIRTNCRFAAKCAAERGVVQRFQFQRENAYA